MWTWDQNGSTPPRTRPAPRKTSNLLFLALFIAAGPLWFTGCETFRKEERINNAIDKSVFTRVYFASYESVWRAAQLALKYPISVNNMDNGVLETDWVRALEGFAPPGSSKIPSSGIRYKISLNMVKGRSQGRESVRVTLRKNLERQRDFFSDPEAMVSDALEENVILYRIERELIIQDALKKVGD